MRNRSVSKLVVPLCVQLPLLLQLQLLSQLAHGQTIVPSQSLTIPSQSDNFVSEQVVPKGTDFSVTVRTSLADEFVKREVVTSNNVAMQVMEANVRGVQTTTTAVQLSSANSSDVARFNVLAQGNVSSNTVGLTPQAAVTTLGSHVFSMTKPVFFDGRQFLTKPAYGSIQARQYPQSVNTVASQFPLIGRLGDQIAWNEVQRRMPMSDSIVVRRVADDVLPQVNSGVDKELVKLNRSWRTLRQQLDGLSKSDRIRWSASSAANSYSTNADNLSIVSRTTKTRKLTGELAERESLVVLLSEESVNRWISWRPLSGLTLSDSTLQSLAQSLKAVQEDPEILPELLKQSTELSLEPLLFSIRFADVDPLTLSFADGMITVRIKFQVVPKVGEPGLMQLVKAQLAGNPGDDGMWSISLHKLSAEPASSNAQPDLYTNIINSPAIAAQIPPTTLPRTIDLQHLNLHPKMPLFRLHRIQSETGQLRISLRVISNKTVTQQGM